MPDLVHFDNNTVTLLNMHLARFICRFDPLFRTFPCLTQGQRTSASPEPLKQSGYFDMRAPLNRHLPGIDYPVTRAGRYWSRLSPPLETARLLSLRAELTAAYTARHWDKRSHSAGLSPLLAHSGLISVTTGAFIAINLVLFSAMQSVTSTIIKDNEHK